MINNKTDEVIEKLFRSLLSRHQIALKISMRGSNKDKECFQYAITFALNNQELGKHPERITKIKSFIDKYKW